MHDIDLIPGAWREQVRMQRWLRRLALAALALLLALGATRGALAWLIAAERPVVERLRVEQTAAQREQAQRATLGTRLDESRERLAAVSALRGGPVADPVFLALDAALSDTVHFQEMRVARPAPLPAPAAPAAGPAPAAPPELVVQGRAASYASLAAFAEALGRQKGIASARVTSSGGPATEAGVQFTLQAALAAPAEGAR